jgi:hypothetical protein
VSSYLQDIRKQNWFHTGTSCACYWHSACTRWTANQQMQKSQLHANHATARTSFSPHSLSHVVPGLSIYLWLLHTQHLFHRLGSLCRYPLTTVSQFLAALVNGREVPWLILCTLFSTAFPRGELLLMLPLSIRKKSGIAVLMHSTASIMEKA